MAFTSVITVDFTGTSHGTSDTFTVTAISNNESDTGVSYNDLQSGYTMTYTELEGTGFTVTAETGVCAGEDVGTVIIPTPTPTPTSEPEATATATPTPAPDATATPTPTATAAYVQQWADFYIDSTGYSNEFDACDNAVLGTHVFFTSSIGTTFGDLISYVDAGNPVEIFTDSDLTIPFTSTTLFHAADSTGPDPSYALLINSSGIGGGVVQTCAGATTPEPTATPTPYVFYELRADLPDGTGWLTSNDACNDGAPTSFGSIYFNSSSLPVTVGDTFYTASQGPGSEFDGGDRYFIKGDGTEAYRIGSTGIVAQVIPC